MVNSTEAGAPGGASGVGVGFCLWLALGLGSVLADQC